MQSFLDVGGYHLITTQDQLDTIEADVHKVQYYTKHALIKLSKIRILCMILTTLNEKGVEKARAIIDTWGQR